MNLNRTFSITSDSDSISSNSSSNITTSTQSHASIIQNYTFVQNDTFLENDFLNLLNDLENENHYIHSENDSFYKNFENNLYQLSIDEQSELFLSQVSEMKNRLFTSSSANLYRLETQDDENKSETEFSHILTEFKVMIAELISCIRRELSLSTLLILKLADEWQHWYW